MENITVLFIVSGNANSGITVYSQS